jgi:uncharacterized protein (DUF2336 family)
MSAQSQEFTSLLGLARRQSPAKRRVLFPLVIAFLYVGAPEMSGSEARAMAAHLCAFFDDVPEEAAREAIARLANMSAPPCELLRALALLRPQFAAPIVHRSGLLDSGDLTIISRTARHCEALCAALAARNDLPPTAAAQIFWRLGADRQEILLAYAADAPDEAFDAARIRTPIRTADDSAQANFVDDIRAGRTDQAASFLAALAGITDECARNVLKDESCQTLAIIAKACRLSKSTYSTMALLAHPACEDNLSTAQERIGFFNNLDATRAWGALRLLRICRPENKPNTGYGESYRLETAV